MRKQSDTKQLHFQGLGPRRVVADFDGGTLTSDAGGLLLREVDLAFGIIDEFTKCFSDYRKQEAIEHPVRQLKIGARVTVSLRRVVIHMAGGYPYKRLFYMALARIQAVAT